MLAAHATACPSLALGFAAYLAQAHGRAMLRVRAPDGRSVGLAIDGSPGWPWRIASGAQLEWNTGRRLEHDSAVTLCWLDSDSGPQLQQALRELADRREPNRLVVVAAPAPSADANNPAALADVLARHDVQPSLVGYANGAERGGTERTLLAVVDSSSGASSRLPPDFDVLAIVPAFNEADIIGHTLQYLIRQGIAVYLLDNWSTDRTVDIARAWLGRGLVAIEQFPAARPDTSYNLRGLLTRVEQIALDVPAAWYVLHDADERRQSPWPELNLREAMWRVDQRGFTAIDHQTLNFWPTTDEPFDQRLDVDQQLMWFEFSTHAGHFHQRRAWKNLGQRVSLADSAGHDVEFTGRRVEPLKFLQKHYPIRSQAHGERKVLRERLPRFPPDERALGWHAQYDDRVAAAQRFVRPPAELLRFDPSTFHAEYFVQRLSGLGVFPEPPPWATPMRRPG